MKSNLLCFSVLFLSACTFNSNTSVDSSDSEALYATKGEERVVSFQADFRTDYETSADVVKNAESIARYSIPVVNRYLFGPLTENHLAAPQKGAQIKLLLDQVRTERGRAIVPYLYEGTWLIKKPASSSLNLPVPYSDRDLQTRNWKACGDSAPEHQTWGFFWYFWNPERSGCDHKLGVHYQNVTVTFKQETQQTQKSFPEYDRMIRTENGKRTLKMTFAFGYVSDPLTPRPFTDFDEGMREFQKFHTMVNAGLATALFKTQPVTLADYRRGTAQDIIGTRWVGQLRGVEVQVTVVAAAGIDQMELFAKSFATDHEAFFGWFGHSRVGSGFDAENFRRMLVNQPETYTLTRDYQLVYWAGCNSYSYYTLPFFEMKATLDANDPHGTKNLDLISNGFPSFFSYNAANAQIVFAALINWPLKTSYQQIVDTLENYAWVPVMVNVLGDEDNPN